MNEAAAYRAATVRAEERRALMLSSLQSAKGRISPSRLKGDAKEMMVDGIDAVTEKARKRPAATGAIAAALLLFWFRRPIGALFGRLYVRIRDRNSENSETDDD